MTDNSEKDDYDNWLTPWEQQCLDEWDTGSDNLHMEDKWQIENERSGQKLWLSFQNSATSAAQLYREGSHQNCVSLWVPFQNLASSLTNLHKDSQDVMKKSLELGIQYGHHKRSKELLTWVRKRRRNIHREDLIAFLCGKPSPLIRARTSSSRSATNCRVSVERSSPRISSPWLQSSGEVSGDIGEPDLQPFRDALALQGLNGAMSSVCVGMDGHGGLSGDRSSQNSGGGSDDFDCFILDEMSRHCATNRKRIANNDVLMDSPTRKRGRHF